MQLRDLPIEEIIARLDQFNLIDARSEKEFQQGRIPGAVSVPLLNNEERIAVGTNYKQEGRIAAVQLGLALVGPKMNLLFERYYNLSLNKKPLVFYCWRGGLRSLISASLFQWSGIPVYRIEGGYKSYRKWIQSRFTQPYTFKIIGGETGSGKTEILKLLQDRGEQIIDLEGLAKHKGSAFGSLGQDPQPSNEDFENSLGLALDKLNRERTIWIENESRLIGTCYIPEGIWQQLQMSTILQIDVSKDVRISRLVKEYAHFEVNILIEKTEILRKKLGGQHLQFAIEKLNDGDFHAWVDTLLVYYDKTYQYSSEKNIDRSRRLSFDWINIEESVQKIIEQPWI
jgi:tRNA 2-selenouridine synthase